MTWTLIFDVDDTLVDTYRTGFEKFIRVAQQLGLPEPLLSEYGIAYGKGSFEDCVSRLFPHSNVDEIAVCYDAQHATVEPIALGNVSQMFDEARSAGWRIGIFTNGSRSKTWRKLQAANVMANQLDFVVTGDDADLRKPAVEAFLQVASDEALDPSTTWFVSDSPQEWQGATAAGMRAVGVYGGSKPARCSGEHPLLMLPDTTHLVVCLRHVDVSAPLCQHAVRAVTFDAGFTLLDHKRTGADCIVEVMRETDPIENQKIPEPSCIAPADWATEAGALSALKANYEELASRCVAKDDVSTVAAEALGTYTAVDNWFPRRGADAVLAAVRANGFAVGVVSNWSSDLPEVLRHGGLLAKIDSVVTSHDAGAAKPDKAIFDHARVALSVDEGELLHIGDDPLCDVAGALNSGNRAVLVEQSQGGLAAVMPLFTAVESLA